MHTNVATAYEESNDGSCSPLSDGKFSFPGYCTRKKDYADPSTVPSPAADMSSTYYKYATI